MQSLTRSLLAGFMLALCTSLTSAQSMPPLSADRPDQTEASSLVPVGYVQAEIGVSHETVTSGTTSTSIPGFLLKYGVRPNIEFRLSSQVASQTSAGTTTSGLAPLTLGMKLWLLDEAGSLPQAAFIGQLSIPEAASSGFTQTFYAPAFRFAMSHTISDRLSLGYNVGAQWDGQTAEPVFAYTVVCGISLAETVGVFGEIYGFGPQRSAADHRFDAGITWLVTPDLMLDLSGGVGIVKNAPDGFFGAGASFRFDTR